MTRKHAIVGAATMVALGIVKLVPTGFLPGGDQFHFQFFQDPLLVSVRHSLRSGIRRWKNIPNQMHRKIAVYPRGHWAALAA